MEDDGTNWLKPWAAKAAEGFPYNGISKRPYNGFNPFLLSAVALAEGYKSSQWATYKQWTDKGGSLAGAKGKGVPVFYWSVKKYKDRNDLDEGGKPKEKTGFLFKNYIVFLGIIIITSLIVSNYPLKNNRRIRLFCLLTLRTIES